MDEYVRNTGGRVVLWFLPPRTPQHNPIEVLWREIKRAIADIYFGGIDQMRTAIIRMLHRDEVAIVSLFRYMLRPWTAATPWQGPAPRSVPAIPVTPAWRLSEHAHPTRCPLSLMSIGRVLRKTTVCASGGL